MTRTEQPAETPKPCPFKCGHGIPPVVSGYCLGSAEELQTDTDKWAYTVRCSCGAQGPECGIQVEAITAWNTRTEQPSSVSLSPEDHDALTDALNNPPEPNERMKSLMRGSVSDELIERVAVAIQRADNEPCPDYPDFPDNPNISDWGIHLARAALAAIPAVPSEEDGLREWALNKAETHHRLARENPNLRTEHIASSAAYRNLADEIADRILALSPQGAGG